MNKNSFTIPFRLAFWSGSIGASMTLGLGFYSPAQSYSLISSTEEFYEAYGSAETFSPEANDMIQGLFEYVEPFMGEFGLQNAANAGFVPMTDDMRFHGTHWFNPASFLNDRTPNPIAPTGLNFDKDGNLVAVFWPAEKYEITLEDWERLNLVGLESVVAAYETFKASRRQPVPDILSAFGDGIDWHSHENVVIENVGSRNPETGFYDDGVAFRQSLTNEAFMNELKTALADPDITVGPLEFFSDTTVYPPFNTIMMPGFYMAHMWLGAKNPDGLFFETHSGVSVNAPGEHLTFEDGSGGHGHGGGHDGGHDGGHSRSIPEPSLVGSLVGWLFFGLWNRARFSKPRP